MTTESLAPEAPAGSTGAVEQHSIDWVPPEDRHGSVRNLFSVWFAANMQITTVVTGALAVIVGLSLPWALLAIVVGNAFGAVFMALHSAQGPKLGIPQMIQSRAQFGFFGAIVPLVLVLLMYLGFFASSGVLGGQALSAWTGLGLVPSILIVSAVCTVAAVLGYRWIHAMERVISVLAVLGFIYLTFRLLQQHDVGKAWHAGSFSFGTFLLAVAIAATWQITYAPYVADYSRYLPESTSARASFGWTYAGSFIGTVWMMAFGSIAAALASKSFGGNSVAFIVDLAPHGAQWVFYVVLLLGVLAINTLNLYGAFMSTTTTASALVKLKMGTGVRTIFVLATAVVGALIAVLGHANFVSNFENFILFLAYFLIPWTAINLVDFYLVRRERYHIPSIEDRGGLYPDWSGPALLAYLLGVLVEVPFMSTTFYTGPMVDKLGGADISWILGLIVSAVVYAAFGRRIIAAEKRWYTDNPQLLAAVTEP